MPRIHSELRSSRGRRPHPASPFVVSLCASALLLGAGCSGSKNVQTRPEPGAGQVTPRVEPPPEPPPLPPPIREVQPTSRATVKVIDPGDTEEKPKTLIEASRLAKARKRGESREPIAEINDDNLAEYAEGADVIILESEPAAPAPSDDLDSLDEDDAFDDDLDAGDIRGEDYWRNRALELRMGWRRTVDELAELELESAALRQQFYAEEDPYIRDSQVKPSWDRALDRMETLRKRARRYEQELEVFVEEGRRAGALQGWLNQGWELEPSEEELRLVGEPASSGISEPSEPEAREPVTGENYDQQLDPDPFR